MKGGDYMISERTIVDVIRMACKNNTFLRLSPQTLGEICRHLEGKQKQMSLREVREWCKTKASLRDPIFIIPKDGPPFWITDGDDVIDFHKSVLTGRYTCWTGRPTGNRIGEVTEVG